MKMSRKQKRWLGDKRRQLMRFVQVFVSGVFVALLASMSSGRPLTRDIVKAAVVAGVVALYKALGEQTQGEPFRGVARLLVGRGATNAAVRGWGNPGTPGGDAGVRFERAHIVRVSAGGISVRVHRDVAPLFVDLINRLVAMGVDFSAVKDDWGFAHRWIRGRDGVLSNHSWGLALDLNSTVNPMGVAKTTFPVNPVRVLLGGRFAGLIRWGMDYAGRKDAMHFEFIGTRDEALALIKKLGLG
jgi:D-alanyl-D-alanine carboxypeptidase